MSMAGIDNPRAQSVDWITPQWILNPLGPFDLDPCASATQPWRTASVMWVPPRDGLALPWHGRVWLNPPYGRHTEGWLTRLADHGDGIALIFARTDTRAFHDQVWARASAVIFLRGRVRFARPDGKYMNNCAGAPSCLVAYGSGNAQTLDHLPFGFFVDVWESRNGRTGSA